jgi:hypothetical protein
MHALRNRRTSKRARKQPAQRQLPLARRGSDPHHPAERIANPAGARDTAAHVRPVHPDHPKIETLSELLRAELDVRLQELHRPRFNIAPGTVTPLVTGAPDRRRLEPGLWGLPGPFAGSNIHINARSETVAGSPAFRDAFARGRCGVLADGFYEWSGPPRPTPAAVVPPA